MSTKTLWKIQYMNLCVSQFAKANKMTQQLSYRYLREFKGMDFLYNMPMAEAFDTIYNSATYQKIKNKNTGLYR